MRAMALAALAAFGIDQLSKWLVVHMLDLQSRLILEVFPPYLVFKMGWNRGINFGLFYDDAAVMRWVLIALALVICAVVVRWALKDGALRVRLSAGLLVGGALGNVLDRVLYGAVADFLNMSCCGITNPFAFNLADVFIFAGAIGLVLWAGQSSAETGKSDP